MSLISLRNFAAPFTSKVHLVAIVLGGLVFAVLRLSTGAIEVRSGLAVQPSESQQISTREVAPEPKAALAAPKHQAPSKTTDPRLERHADPDILGEIVGPSKKSAPPSDDAAPKSGALDDIERSLGLR